MRKKFIMWRDGCESNYQSRSHPSCDRLLPSDVCETLGLVYVVAPASAVYAEYASYKRA